MSLLQLKNIAIILEFLSSVHCYPSLDIEIIIDNNAKYLGFYQENVITLRSNFTDRILVHELYHSCQQTPKNQADWFLKENQAKQIERLWLDWVL